MSREAQQIGKLAEERVVGLALQRGLQARLATREEDGAGKTDVVIEPNVLLQVSVNNKSRGARKRLAMRGVYCVEAGSQVSDEHILTRILTILNQT
ncbi:MAG: hypothetical protein Q7S31_03430 [bacterium]|nr:hypothetical protein [bacterium]